jgi:hypothetical protein
MNLTELEADLDLKTFGPKNVSNLTTAQKDLFINKGQIDFFSFLIKNKEIGYAYFYTFETPLTIISSDYYLFPSDLYMPVLIQNSDRTATYVAIRPEQSGRIGNFFINMGIDATTLKRKIRIYESGEQKTSGNILVSYIRSPSTLSSGGVTTPEIDPIYHDIITDYGAYEYYMSLGGGYVADAQRWLEVAQSKASQAKNNMYWQIMDDDSADRMEIKTLE